jgi:DNA-binding CsgD family transcriptional regulator
MEMKMVTHAGDSGHRAARLQGILLTDLSLRVAAIDTGAAAILADSNGSERRDIIMAALPEEVIRKLRGQPATELHDRTISFRVAKGNYVCRVSVLHPCESRLGAQTMLALHLYRDTDVREEIDRFAAEYDLTERERQTLLGIANGLTSKEIAERLNISPNTVKSFLRLMMVKIGVARRGEIISKVLAHQRHRT